MKRLIPTLLLLFFSSSVCCAQTSGTLTTLQAIAALDNEQAARGPAVAFDATVLYYRSYEKTLFVQDGAATIYISANSPLELLPGDRIHVRGILAPSFRPIVVRDTIDLLHHGSLPTPLTPRFAEMMNPDFDSRLVKLRARVRSADVILSSHRKSGDLQLLCEGNNLEAVIDSDDAAALHQLLDADVEIVGVIAGKFDGKFQRTGLLLHITGLAQVKVLRPASSDAFALPLTQMDQMYAGFHVQDSRERVRVRGVITYYQPGAVVVLQDGSRSLWVSTHSRDPLRIGDIADASGYPDVRSGFLALTRSEVQDTGKWAPIAPIPADWNLLATSTHIFDLVSYQGVIVAEVRAGSQDEYILAADGKLITAVFRHPSETSELPTPPMRLIPLGSRIRVTGVCVPENSNPFDYDKGLNIFLRNYDDLAVLADPPWLNMRTLGLIAGLLLAIALLAGFRSWFLERKVRRQTVAMARRISAEAALEHRRSIILEDINGTRPLQEILIAILAMITFKLDGASCWCQIGDESPIGELPPEYPTFAL